MRTPQPIRSRRMPASVILLAAACFWGAPVFALSDLPARSGAFVALRVNPPCSFADVAEGAMPAVVNISTTKKMEGRKGVPPSPFGEEDSLEEFFRRFFGERSLQAERRTTGSGFIISEDGTIVTTSDLIGDAQQIMVRLSQPQAGEYAAAVVGVDENTNLAVIKISANRRLPTVPLGSSAKLRVGDWVIAIGNPFGLEQTVTAGLVSAKGRIIGAGPMDDFIQTDASINPGSSGGPLLNLQGEVVGINTTILSRTGGNIGIAFAIPMDLAKPVIAQLRATGKVPRGWLGVTLQAVTPDLAGLFGMDEARGALVAEVTKNGPAEAAGLQRGDIITTFNGVRIKEFRELLAMVARASVGDHVSVTVFRDGRESTVSVTLGEIPSRQVGSGHAEQRAEHWGMTLANISPEHARRFRLERDQKGVVVIEIESGSPAELAGFQPGDVIERVNRQPIQSLEDFDTAATEAEDRDTVLLLVRRGGFASFNVLRRKEQQKAPQGEPDESFSLNDRGGC